MAPDDVPEQVVDETKRVRSQKVELPVEAELHEIDRKYLHGHEQLQPGGGGAAARR